MKRLKRSLTRLRIFILILIICLVGAIVYIVSNQPQARPIPDLATYTVARNDVENKVSVDGNVTGLINRDLVIPAGARVLELYEREGDSVSKSSPILRYEVETVTGSEEGTIYSPIEGVLVQNDAIGGNTYYSPTVFGKIVNTNGYKVLAYVNENDIYLLAKNQTVEIILPAISLDKVYEGKVTFIDLTADLNSGGINYAVEVTFDEAPSEIRLGMTAEMEILTAHADNVIAIPENFIIEKEDRYYVNRITWLNSEKTEYELTEIEVTTGLITDELVEIRRGITVGDELLEPSFIEERNIDLLSSFQN